MSQECQFILCDCRDPEHQMLISWDGVVDQFYWDEMSITTHLPKISFFRRCVYAVRYIFGYQSKTGAFSEMVLGDVQVTKLRAACDTYLAKSKEFKEKFVK